MPKLQNTLRCSPCFNSSVTVAYDQCLHDTLEAVLNVQLSEHAWLQASVPVSAGGLGVRTASQIVLLAFLSSVIGSADLCSKILTIRLRHAIGIHDVFTAACNTWKSRTIPMRHRLTAEKKLGTSRL